MMTTTKNDLIRTNARLHTLIEIGLELASERDMERLLHKVCDATRHLFQATYVTLGILDLDDRTVTRVVSCGSVEAPWIAAGETVPGLLGTVTTERRTIRGMNPDGDPLKLMLPASHPPVKSFLAAPIASPAHVYGWICFVGNDGREFTEDDEHLVMALSGQVGRIYENGHFHALAERRLSDLIRERDRAQRYLDTAEVMLIALDKHARIKLVNRFACNVLGWKAEDLMGRDWIDTCLPERIRDVWRHEKYDEVLDGHVAFGENPVLTRSGEERQIEWRNTVLRDDAGQVTGTLSSGTDITERQALEAQFQHSQKMDAIGQLAGGIAHDFNNLLTVILGFSNLLLADLAVDDPHRGDIAEIHQAGQRAAALTRQLLTFSRKQLIEPVLLDLNVVTEEMREMLQRLIGDDVRIIVASGPSPALMLCDHGQIEQVIMNLVVNARDAMPGGGAVTIEITDVTLGAEQMTRGGRLERGPYVKITVTDTGVGMTGPVLAHLFEPFFTTKGPGKGTGLGLATVHGIAGRCGGGIDVTSVLGRGTTFTLYFPQALPGPLAARLGAPASHASACTQLVLVVDDDQGVRDLARRMLGRLGYRVLGASDAAEARSVFLENPSIDLILTDVVMPGESGPECVRSLQVDHPGLRVVYMSGYAEDAIAHRGVLDPGIVFLHKPFTAETLLLKISEGLDAIH
jgi:two-component system cell cycle sensor histidine kinase/response regulator CckA